MDTIAKNSIDRKGKKRGVTKINGGLAFRSNNGITRHRSKRQGHADPVPVRYRFPDISNVRGFVTAQEVMLSRLEAKKDPKDYERGNDRNAIYTKEYVGAVNDAIYNAMEISPYFEEPFFTERDNIFDVHLKLCGAMDSLCRKYRVKWDVDFEDKGNVPFIVIYKEYPWPYSYCKLQLDYLPIMKEKSPALYNAMVEFVAIMTCKHHWGMWTDDYSVDMAFDWMEQVLYEEDGKLDISHEEASRTIKRYQDGDAAFLLQEISERREICSVERMKEMLNEAIIDSDDEIHTNYKAWLQEGLVLASNKEGFPLMTDFVPPSVKRDDYGDFLTMDSFTGFLYSYNDGSYNHEYINEVAGNSTIIDPCVFRVIKKAEDWNIADELIGYKRAFEFLNSKNQIFTDTEYYDYQSRHIMPCK